MNLKAISCVCVCLLGFSIVEGKVQCEDVSHLCRAYPKEMCYGKFSDFMEENCANYCGYCNCRNWRYGCCKNTDVRADGPNEFGCPVKLCYDKRIEECPIVKKNGTCDKYYNRIECAWSCGNCRKSPAPMRGCINLGYGCCWDGSAALGPNKKGCPPCFDMYGTACKQFKITPCTNTGAFYLRSFLLKYCNKTCGRCGHPTCKDRDSRCPRFKRKGYCYHGIWRSYLRSSCAKSCGFCKDTSEGNLP